MFGYTQVAPSMRFKQFTDDELAYLQMVLTSSPIYSPVREEMLKEINYEHGKRTQQNFIGGSGTNYNTGW